MKLSFAALGLMAIASTPALAQRDFSGVEIKTVAVAPGLYMLEGAGGNIGLSVGDDGAFVIDDQFAPLSAKILAAIDAVSEEPVRFVVNTHWHGDHTGGNEPMSGAGALIVAHDNVRKRLKEGLDGEWKIPPAPKAALPVITFSDEVSFYWNGDEILVRHPVASAHTDGDSIVYFKTANAVHMGDVYFNGRYPFIDLDSGGGLDGYIAAQESVLAKIDDKTKVIPGHGPLSNKAELAKTTAMLKDVRARVQKLIDRGMDEDAVVKAEPLKDLDGKWSWDFIDGEKMTRAAYRSLAKD